MRLPTLSVGGWIAAVCLAGSSLWACSSDDTNPFARASRGGQSGSAGSDTGGTEQGGASGSSSGGMTGGTETGGSSNGGDGNGGTTSGGTTGDGGAAADAGSDSGGTATGGASGTSGAGGAGTNGNGGTPMGGAGMSGAAPGGTGAGVGGAGMGGAGTAGGGMGGAGKGGSGGMPGDCEDDGDCPNRNQYCKKATCDAAKGTCQARGPECRSAMAEFDPVCGCDGITYWNTCVIEHEGFNVAQPGECTGGDRPACTRDQGSDSCPERLHAHCYRPVAVCGDPSPNTGVCWVLPTECPANEPQTERYCGGTAGSARCIGLCEVIEAENSFRRDSAQCDN